MSPRTPAQAPGPPAPDPGKPYITVDDLCRRWGVKPRAIYSYRARSKPGGIYENRPFPEPRYQHGRYPVWAPDQLKSLDEWKAGMPGRGAGGGRPPVDRAITRNPDGKDVPR